MSKNLITEKWNDMLVAEGLPEVAMDKKDVIATLLENQEASIQADPVYKNPEVVAQFNTIQEAVVSGDHGGVPANVASGTNTGAAVSIGPQILGLVRRAMPKLIAFDIAGVQPMTQSTGQVFTFRKIYGGNPTDPKAREAQHPTNIPDVAHSGQGSVQGAIKAYKDLTGQQTVGTLVSHEFEDAQTGDEVRYFQVAVAFTPDTTGATTTDKIEKDIADGKLVEIGHAMATSIAELQEGFNGQSNNPYNEMSLRIDKQTVEAQSRQLKAKYSLELAQDLKAVHGLNADQELSNILAEEVMLEIDREVIQWINATAQVGKTGFTNRVTGSKPGVFDMSNALDVKGARWHGESYKALLVQIDKEANEIARQTGRGAGNIVIASRNVVAALAATDALVGYAAAGLAKGLNTDTNKSLFAGVLGGKYKVYIDHYAREDYVTVGYKGAGAMDTGIVYCPYIPLTPLQAIDPQTFSPVLGVKTRYAVAVNPLADPANNKVAKMAQVANGMPGTHTFGRNAYYRRFLVRNL